MSNTTRRRLFPWLVAAVLAVLLALCLLWIWLHLHDHPSGVEGSGESSSQSSGQDFVMAVSLTRPITPGVWSPLDVSLTNTGDATILVSGLNISVSEVIAPHADVTHPCSVNDFAVRQAAAGLHLSLAAGETSSLSTFQLPVSNWPQVRLIDTSVNQDGCKESTITLTYTGEGRQMR